MGDRNGKGAPADSSKRHRSKAGLPRRSSKPSEIEHEIGRRVWALPPSAARVAPRAMLERRAKHAAEVARTERDRLALVPTFDPSEIDMLEGLLEAFQAADHAAKNGGESSARVGKLVRRGEKIRDALRAAARFYLRGDASMTNELGAVSAGDRPGELARELAALVTLVKLRPTSADDPALEKAVRRAESIGGELATLPDDGERDAAYAKRSQIGLLLADSVDEVGAALRYVYRDKPKKLARLG